MPLRWGLLVLQGESNVVVRGMKFLEWLMQVGAGKVGAAALGWAMWWVGQCVRWSERQGRVMARAALRLRLRQGLTGKAQALCPANVAQVRPPHPCCSMATPARPCCPACPCLQRPETNIAVVTHSAFLWFTLTCFGNE